MPANRGRPHVAVERRRAMMCRWRRPQPGRPRPQQCSCRFAHTAQLPRQELGSPPACSLDQHSENALPSAGSPGPAGPPGCSPPEAAPLRGGGCGGGASAGAAPRVPAASGGGEPGRGGGGQACGRARTRFPRALASPSAPPRIHAAGRVWQDLVRAPGPAGGPGVRRLPPQEGQGGGHGQEEVRAPRPPHLGEQTT